MAAAKDAQSIQHIKKSPPKELRAADNPRAIEFFWVDQVSIFGTIRTSSFQGPQCQQTALYSPSSRASTNSNRKLNKFCFHSSLTTAGQNWSK